MRKLNIFNLTHKNAVKRTRRSGALDEQVVVCKNTGGQYMTVFLGKTVMKKANIVIGSRITCELLENGNIAIMPGQDRQVNKMTGNQERGQINLPKVFLVKETLRITPIIEPGRIELSIPNDTDLVEDLTEDFIVNE